MGITSSPGINLWVQCSDQEDNLSLYLHNYLNTKLKSHWIIHRTQLSGQSLLAKLKSTGTTYCSSTECFIFLMVVGLRLDMFSWLCCCLKIILSYTWSPYSCLKPLICSTFHKPQINQLVFCSWQVYNLNNELPIRQFINSLPFEWSSSQEPTFPQPILYTFFGKSYHPTTENPTIQDTSSWSFYLGSLQEKTKCFSWTQPVFQVFGCGLRLYSWTTALSSQTCDKLEGKVKVLQ